MGSAPTIAEGGGGRRLAGLSEFRLRFGRSAKGGLSVAARLTAWSPGPRLVAGSRRAVRSVHSVGMSGAAVRWPWGSVSRGRVRRESQMRLPALVEHDCSGGC